MNKKWRSIQADLNAKLSSWRMSCSNRRLKPSITRPCCQKCPITLINMPTDRSGNCKENPDVQIPKSTLKLRRSEFSTEWCAHWMIETLAGLTLMKDISKWSETLQEYRSGDGKNNPGARISKIPLNRCRSEISTEWCAPLDDWNPSRFGPDEGGLQMLWNSPRI